MRMQKTIIIIIIIIIAGQLQSLSPSERLDLTNKKDRDGDKIDLANISHYDLRFSLFQAKCFLHSD